MSHPFEGVQRIVLHGTVWQAAAHLMLDFRGKSPLHLLELLLQDNLLSFVQHTNGDRPDVQISLGFTRRGLEHAAVREHVLACFALKAPAFFAGAALRAAADLGLSGDSAPHRWDSCFGFENLDAVLSVHANQPGRLDAAVDALTRLTHSDGLDCLAQLKAAALQAPPDVEVLADPSGRPPQWVPFGYRDGLSHIGIESWTQEHAMRACKPASRHKAGEFVLGHAQDSGANPWVSGPGLVVWPSERRRFFHNGSFGVLQQIEQHVAEFEHFVEEKAREMGYTAEDIKAKLCGRFPDGRPLADPRQRDPTKDFDYAEDRDGHRCPFGSHVRRMNPRLARADANLSREKGRAQTQPLAHFSRSRPLLRRGMPYEEPESAAASMKQGLLGQFFCASIEDQYEHLLGQWADRVPLGSPDRGGARDPFIGAHAHNDGPFEIPGAEGSVQLTGLHPFTRTRGVAYLFYPSASTLRGIADSSPWIADTDDDG